MSQLWSQRWFVFTLCLMMSGFLSMGAPARATESHAGTRASGQSAAGAAGYRNRADSSVRHAQACFERGGRCGRHVPAGHFR